MAKREDCLDYNKRFSHFCKTKAAKYEILKGFSPAVLYLSFRRFLCDEADAVKDAKTKRVWGRGKAQACVDVCVCAYVHSHVGFVWRKMSLQICSRGLAATTTTTTRTTMLCILLLILLLWLTQSERQLSLTQLGHTLPMWPPCRQCLKTTTVDTATASALRCFAHF